MWPRLLLSPSTTLRRTGDLPSQDSLATGGDVATLTADTVRSLAGFKGVGGPVVSLYLDVDGQRYIRPRDYEVQLDHLLRRAREPMAAAGTGAGTGAEEDLRRVEAHVRSGLDRSHTRGLALFSCAAHGLFEAVE